LRCSPFNKENIMKTLTSLYCAASAAALALSPVSLELAASLFVAVGVLAIMARDYGQSSRRGAGVA
jgi:hypothetical protein